MSNDKINLTAMPTPNPNTIKFLVENTFFERGSIDFPIAEKAESSPLPKALFDIKGIEGVMIGTNFISITKHDDEGWENVLEVSSNLIKDMLSDEKQTLFDPELIKKTEETGKNDSESVKRIKEILDNEIRPAIAMDGGDCEFIGFEDGILTLQLQGACSSCPSSVMTLKMGIENRLREDIPELKEVVQI